MAPSPCTDPSAGVPWTDADIDVLLDIAESAITTALRGDRPGPPAVDDLPPSLRETCGAFVTLHVAGALNGCIGTIEAAEPLGVAVHRLALSAAFRDYRLPDLRPSDVPALDIEISLLTPLTPIPVTSRAELVRALVPHVDGLEIDVDGRRAVFLPSVWDQVRDADEFVDLLWRKAGVVPGTWTSRTRAWRFHARRYERHAGDPGHRTAG